MQITSYVDTNKISARGKFSEMFVKIRHDDVTLSDFYFLMDFWWWHHQICWRQQKMSNLKKRKMVLLLFKGELHTPTFLIYTKDFIFSHKQDIGKGNVFRHFCENPTWWRHIVGILVFDGFLMTSSKNMLTSAKKLWVYVEVDQVWCLGLHTSFNFVAQPLS